MNKRTLINSSAVVLLTVGLTSAADASANAGVQSGIASVYPGGHTANGEHARAGGLTAAHRSLAVGTRVNVNNPP
jgi:rare lipoprotein A (peptidoglycan hydrolase)